MTRPGRADDDVRAALQALQLRRIALAAVDRQHVEAGHLRGVFLEGFGDLDGQFARRHQHQRLRARSAIRRCVARIGRAKAAVLPVPVWACPSTSSPSSMRGMVSPWIGEGDS